MDTLLSKFGGFWPPFDRYLQNSGVSLADVDHDTDWESLLSEVPWPTGCTPNVAQRSSLKKALKSYCKLRDAALGYVSIGGLPALAAPSPLPGQVSSPEQPMETQVRGRRLSVQSCPVPLAGSYARNFSTRDAPTKKAPVGGAVGPRVFKRSYATGNQGLMAGRPEDDHTAKLLEDCFQGGAPSKSSAKSSSHASKRSSKSSRRNNSGMDAMVDSLLGGTPAAPANQSSRIFASVPESGDQDLFSLADALLQQDGEPAGRAAPAKSAVPSLKLSRTKAVPINSETCPKEEDECEKRLRQTIEKEYQAYRRKAAPRHKNQPLMPNFKAPRPDPSAKPAKPLHIQNAELLDFCGIDKGTVCEYWLCSWRDRGRPNRGIDLEELEEDARRFMEENRHGRPVVDDWALGRALQTYGNMQSELQRNMIADEMAEKVDADGDCALDMDEFRRLYAETHPGQTITDEQIAQAWEFADKDDSGEVDFGEMMLWLDKVAGDLVGRVIPEK